VAGVFVGLLGVGISIIKIKSVFQKFNEKRYKRDSKDNYDVNEWQNEDISCRFCHHRPDFSIPHDQMDDP